MRESDIGRKVFYTRGGNPSTYCRGVLRAVQPDRWQATVEREDGSLFHVNADHLEPLPRTPEEIAEEAVEDYVHGDGRKELSCMGTDACASSACGDCRRSVLRELILAAIEADREENGR